MKAITDQSAPRSINIDGLCIQEHPTMWEQFVPFHSKIYKLNPDPTTYTVRDVLEELQQNQ